ncbi:MAG TPA: ABC transporter permease [Rhizomicrobium sp.]|jgi:NitT/TauT family transport system permease protein|nr:ABC transporter permease [Rhizomicrobium sp.]
MSDDPNHFIIEDVVTPKNLNTVKRLSLPVRLWRITAVRRLAVVLVVLVVWEIAARWADTPLLLPSVLDTLQALKDAMTSQNDNLLSYISESLKLLLAGFALGAVVAGLLTIFAVNTQIGEDFLSTITSAFAPLPAIAIFPLALMWLGISDASVIFITTWATIFPVAVAMFQGFRGVSQTLRDVGRNFGLRGLSHTARMLIPAALPSIMTGFRNGLSNAFRALVALEMVMGAASGTGGLGWFVMSQKQNLEIPAVFAGIIAIMAIGLAFEGLFALVERRTVRRWGMLR